MSSDIKEVKRLKEVLGRSKVSKIKKRYNKIEKKICKRLFEEKNIDTDEFVFNSGFIEFRKRYFGNLYRQLSNILEASSGELESEMMEFIYEKRRNKTFEVICLIKNILNRNGVLWAMSREYLGWRKECRCPDDINIIICSNHKNKFLNVFNIIGVNVGGSTYLINDIRVEVSFSFKVGNQIYDLNSENIEYCLLENEKIPMLK